MMLGSAVWSMIEDLASRLIDAETGFFRWWSRNDRVDLYQTGVGWPLLAGILDGFGVPAAWQQAHGASKSETLFRALRYLSGAWSAFYIKDQDDAYSELDWATPLDSAGVAPLLLNEFESNPADEGGSAYLGLYTEDPANLVLFSYTPGESFCISLLGTMRTSVPEALARVGAG